MRSITHPDYAALVDPLFACGGEKVFALGIETDTGLYG
jgi:hypothetical protein